MVGPGRGWNHPGVSTDPARKLIDPERVAAAVDGLGDRGVIEEWAQRFSVVADPSRLALLVSIHYAREISVTDLAAVTGMTDTAVSQALRLLRAHGLVTTRRDGRVVRYRLADATVHELIHRVRPHPEEHPEKHQGEPTGPGEDR
ncbi:MAG: ArsR family transcriptional regulator, lead/cadmium/zinc/bismuth-responsive transcriptional [Actinomycetota bacterium]|nr:ArsR family transcriptional regulator, lead/cadmium/zinc/bismuth-responsive transcriptional [Actinomycetota bacterium]